MKSLISRLSKTQPGIFLRNFFNIKPVHFKNLATKYPVCVSDAFLWRTDEGYRTIFKFSDILNLFYDIDNSWVELHFYSKNNQLIKKKKITNLYLSNKFEINSKFLNHINDYGVFYIYHFSKDINNLRNKDVISNRCYLGYSYKKNLYSIVHGNTYGKFAGIYPDSKIFSDIINVSSYKNQTYTIQKFFGDFDKNELFFTNPTTKTIKFSIEKKIFYLKPNFTKLINTSSSIVSIKSNCMFFRPTVFSYKGKYMDVHHS